RGIQRYIAAHQYGSASAADLWAALEAASGQPVPVIASDWFTRPGFPLVTVSAAGSDLQKLLLEQRRFRAGREAREKPEPPWAIPLTLAFEDDEGVRRHRILLTDALTQVLLPAHGKVRWVSANAGELGYYRTHYDQTLRSALANSWARLPAEERFGLLDNAWALAHKGALPIDDFLDLVVRARGDDTRIVVEGLAGCLETLGERVGSETARPLRGRLLQGLARYVTQYRTAATPEERDRYLQALGDFAEPGATPSILAFVLSADVRGQDLWKPLRGLLANPATQSEAWSFVKANWTELRKKG